MNGTIESTTTDWRGDTLAAATTATDTVLNVGDTSDFDEDGGWLVRPDGTPVQYLSCDEDAATVTLAAAVGAVYEAGEPLVLWDPTVLPAGAQVVEYVASVMTERGPLEAVIPHAVVPLAGVDRLDGASVSIDQEDDGDWYVAQVFGRDPSIEQTYVDTPFITLYQAANVGWASSLSYGPMVDWTISDQAEGAFSYNAATGELTILQAGLYLFGVSVMWAGNSSGQRYIHLDTSLGGTLQGISGSPPDNQDYAQQVNVLGYRVAAGEVVTVQVHQTSGLPLNLRGSSDGRLTNWRVVRVQA